MLGAETHRPYIRPPLSKGFLAGADELDSVFVEAEGWYASHDVTLSLGETVDAIDPEAQFVFLASGEALMYDKLLLTTGASPRALDVPGADLTGVFALRTLDDSQGLREALGGSAAGGEVSAGGGDAAGDSDGASPGADTASGGVARVRRVVVIGSGWIGMEVAATARTLGNEVTVLSRGEIPLASVLGDEVGRVFLELHQEHGVVVRTGVEVAEVLGGGAEGGAGSASAGASAGDCGSAAGVEGAAQGGLAGGEGGVTGVRLTSGEVVPADVVVVGLGALPNIQLAEAAGLEIENGIVVNAALRTSDPNIWAAGDVANAYHPVLKQRLRSEHWANALNQGPAAAKSMLGKTVSYDEIPYFYSDQFDLGMEYSGYAPLTHDATVVFRGDVAAREFIAFWVHGGRVVAGMNVNVWDVNDAVQGIIRRANVVDLARLADPAVPLDQI